MQLNLPGKPKSGPKVKYGWFGEALQLFQANAGIWVLATLFQFIFWALSAFPIAKKTYIYNVVPIGEEHTTNGLFLLIWWIFVSIPSFRMFWRLDSATYRMANKQVAGKTLRFADIWDSGSSAQPIFWLTLLMYIATVLGLWVLVVPGLLVLALATPAYALVANGNSIGRALGQSLRGMRNDWGNAILVVVLLWLLLLISGLPCGLGLLVTFPMYKLLVAIACRDMIGMSSIATTDESLPTDIANKSTTDIPQPDAQSTVEDAVNPQLSQKAQSIYLSKPLSRNIAIGVFLIGFCLLCGFWLIHRANTSAPTAPTVASVNNDSSAVSNDSSPSLNSLANSNFPVQWGPYTVKREDFSDSNSDNQQRVSLCSTSGKVLWEAQDVSVVSVSEYSISGESQSQLRVVTSDGSRHGNVTCYYFSREGGLYLLFSDNLGDSSEITGFTNYGHDSHPERLYRKVIAALTFAPSRLSLQFG